MVSSAETKKIEDVLCLNTSRSHPLFLPVYVILPSSTFTLDVKIVIIDCFRQQLPVPSALPGILQLPAGKQQERPPPVGLRRDGGHKG